MSIAAAVFFAILCVIFSFGIYLWYVTPEPHELSRR